MLNRCVRRISGALAAVAVAAAIPACSPNDAITVRGMYGPGVPFERVGETWSWVPAPRHATGDPAADNPSLHQFIQSTIETDLAVRGCRVEDPRNADVWVDYFVGHQKKLFHYSGATFTEFEEGSLIIDLINPMTHTLMWRGIASAKVDATDPPDVRQDRIRRAVTQTFDWLPWQRPDEAASASPDDTTGTH